MYPKTHAIAPSPCRHTIKKGDAPRAQQRNTRRPITPSVIRQVQQLANKNTPTRVIGLLTGRTVKSVRNIASEHGISLKPTNQSPYGKK